MSKFEKKILLLTLISVCLGGSGVFATSSANAMSETLSNTQKNISEKSTKKSSLSLSADKLRYSDLTKEVNVFGNVELIHGEDVFHTDKIDGNTDSEKYIIPNFLNWKRQNFEVNAKKGEYYGKTSNAYLYDIEGLYQGKYYFKGKELEKQGNDGLFIVKNGYLTTKSAMAKIPDYRIEAETLEFLPGNYYIVKNAKLMVKNTEILHINERKGRLGKRKKLNLWYLLPRVKTSRDLGIGIYNTIYYPIGLRNNINFYIENEWYTKAGYVPDVGFEKDEDNYNIKIHAAREQSSVNDDIYFIWKKPSIDFEVKERQIGNYPLYIKTSGDLGYWSENEVKGTHFGMNINVAGKTFTINKKVDFDWSLGYSHDYYGFNKKVRTDKYYNLAFRGKFNKFDMGIKYTDHNFSGETPYNYDKYENIKPIAMSIKVPITRLDEFEVKYVIDTSSGILKNRYYTYYRDMHSLKGRISYDSVKNRIDAAIDFKDF